LSASRSTPRHDLGLLPCVAIPVCHAGRGGLELRLTAAARARLVVTAGSSVNRRGGRGTMRVVRLRATGGPEQLAVEEAGRPRPGPGKALVRMHAAAITRDEPAGSVRRGPGDLEPPRAHPEPELARAHARGLRVYVKEALANSRLAGREPTPALEAAARSAGTTPDALALAAVPARPWADVIVSGAASVRRPRARSPRGSRRTSTSRATTQARAARLLQHRSLSSATTAKRRSSSGVRATAVGAQVAAQRLGRAPWPRRRSPRWTS
jgi:hypothetical protein